MFVSFFYRVCRAGRKVRGGGFPGEARAGWRGYPHWVISVNRLCVGKSYIGRAAGLALNALYLTWKRQYHAKTPRRQERQGKQDVEGLCRAPDGWAENAIRCLNFLANFVPWRAQPMFLCITWFCCFSGVRRFFPWRVGRRFRFWWRFFLQEGAPMVVLRRALRQNPGVLLVLQREIASFWVSGIQYACPVASAWTPAFVWGSVAIQRARPWFERGSS